MFRGESALPKQASILSSTAIEKCFKAVLAFRGNESRGHFKSAHWNAVQNFDPELFNRLDTDFLKLNQKTYLLRYTDSVPVGFNLIVASREFLAELDYTVFEIFRRFTVERNGKKHQTPFDAAVSTVDPRVIQENHVLMNADKRKFIRAKPQAVYEVRNDARLGLIEVTYETTRVEAFRFSS